MNSLTARLAIVCLCWLPWLDVSAMVTNKTVTIKPSDPVALDWDVTLQPKDTANFTVNIVNSEVINGVTYVKSGGPWYKIVPDGPAWSWKGGPTSFTLCNQSPELATASVVVSCKWSRVSSGGGGVGTPDYILGSASASADLKVGHIEWQTGPSPLPVFDKITWTVKLVKENGQLVEGMSPQFNMSPVNVTPPCLWVVEPAYAPGPQLSGTVTATNGSKGKLRVDYDYFGVAKYSICPSNLAFVCVDKLRYRTATNASWIDVPTTGVVYLATNEVDVLALREPSDVPWPAGKPVWGGCADGSGTDQVHVALTPGTVNNVIAECGNVKTGAFAVLKVDLKAEQEGARRVINVNNKDVLYTLTVDPAVTGLKYEWDLNGDGDFNTDPFETGDTLATRTVKYSPSADSASNVNLPETVANRRRDYTVGVRIKDSGGNSICDKSLLVRVALGTDKGTAFAAGTQQQQLDAYGWTDTSPVSFDTATPDIVAAIQSSSGTTEDINDKRLAYGTAGPVGATIWFPPGVSPPLVPGVYGVVLTTPAWSWNKEELDSIVEHERTHCLQNYLVLHVPTSNYRALFDQAGFNVYQTFSEAKAYSVQIAENVSYRYLGDPAAAPPGGGCALDLFKAWYDAAKANLGTLSGSVKTWAESNLQTIYSSVPFEEMKDTAYTPHITAP